MPKPPYEELNWVESVLASAPPGTKLPRSLNKDGSRRVRQNDPSFAPQYDTHYSWLKDQEGKIHPLSHEVLGAGKYGRVKRSGDEVIKIEKNKASYSEVNILTDLNIARGKVLRADGKKYYTLMQDLGESLRSILEKNGAELDECQRFNIAIDLCLKLHRLHCGLDSQSHTRYAHLDLKPANITIDKYGKVNLVDFGASSSSPEQVPIVYRGGTPLYQVARNFKLSMIQLDNLALKRSLFLPEHLLTSKGDVKYDVKSIEPAILTQDMVKGYNLEAYIDTSYERFPDIESFARDTTSPIVLAAILIAAKMELGIDYAWLANDKFLCFVLTSLHEQAKSRDEMMLIFEEALKERSLSTSAGRIAIFCSQQLGLQISADIFNQDIPFARRFNKLVELDLAYHWQWVETLSCRDQIIWTSNPEVRKAVKLILDNLSEQPHVAQSCLEELFTTPAIAQSLTKETLVVKTRLQEQSIKNLTEQSLLLRQIFETTLVGNWLQSNPGFSPWFEVLVRCPGFGLFVTTCNPTGLFYSRLRKDLNNYTLAVQNNVPPEDNHFLDLYRERMHLFALCDRRDIKELDVRLMSNEQAIALENMDRYLTGYQIFQYFYRGIFDPLLFVSATINPACAINAVVASGCQNPDRWIRWLTWTENPRVAEVFIRAACSQKDQPAANYDAVLACLSQSSNTDDEIEARWALWQIGGKDDIHFITEYNAERIIELVHNVPKNEPQNYPRELAVIKANILGLENNVENFARSTRSIEQLNGVLGLANTREKAMFYISICQHLDVLKTKRDTFRVGSRKYAALQDIIGVMDEMMANRAPITELQDRVVRAIQANRPVLSAHRGMLGILDTTLMVILAAVSLSYFYFSYVKPKREQGIEYTFFKTQSDKLVLATDESVDEALRDFTSGH